MARIDLFTTSHKGLRAALFSVSKQAARTDFGQVREAAAFVDAVRRLAAFLADHSQVEELVVGPVVRRLAPSLASALHDDHVRLAGMERELLRRVERLAAAGPAERLSHGRKLEQQLARLIAEQLRHMEREEVVANRLLWAHLDDDALHALEEQLHAALPAERQVDWLALLLPVVSAPEQARLVERSRAHATAAARVACFALLLLSLLLPLLPVACSRADAAAASELPPTLAATGLYADPATKRIAADVLPFVPQYPLWSDGATKRRWIRLPAGSAIDASDPDSWKFPRGTQLWKEFSFGRRVETRYLELGADGTWRFASYLWDAREEEAPLAPERGVPGHCESRPGVRYDIPSRLDCAACHRAGDDSVLGFGALQLSPDRDPLAPHAEPLVEGAVDLAELVRRGLVRGLPAALQDAPPRIAAATPRERAALGYLHANCGICHNASGPLAALGLELDVRVAPEASDAVAPAIASALGQPSRYHCRDTSERVAPGDPAKSVLTRRMAARDAVAQMPPLGSRVADDAALALLREWIDLDLATNRSSR